MEYHGLSIEQIKEYFPGYIGGSEMARKMTDNEVVMLCQLSDEIARLSNQIFELERQRKNIYKVIERRQ